MLRLQLHPRHLGLLEDQRSEVVLTVATADERLHQLVGEGDRREGDLRAPGSGQSEFEVLAEESGRERRVEVEVDECRGLVQRIIEDSNRALVDIGSLGSEVDGWQQRVYAWTKE